MKSLASADLESGRVSVGDSVGIRMVSGSDPDSWILSSILVTRGAAHACWGMVVASEGAVLLDIGSGFGLASGCVGVRMVSGGSAGSCGITGGSDEDKLSVRHKFRPSVHHSAHLGPCQASVVGLWSSLARSLS